MKVDFKDYEKATFTCHASVVEAPKEEAEKAIASLQDLQSLLEISQEKIDNNPDLTYIAADLFIGGIANKNRDAVTVEDAIDLASQVPNKYLNLEHKEKQIVGALISYGFREYDEERKLIAADKDLDSIIVSVGGYIWSSVFPELSEFLKGAQDPESETYNMASLSWEVYFKDYFIMIGSDKISEAEIIEDEDEIEKLTPFLKQKGGSGVYKGKEIYRLVKGPKLMLGAGIVKNPAADVKGIFVKDDEEKPQKKTDASEQCELADSTVGTKKKMKSSKIISKNFSQSKKLNVIKKYKAMKIKNIEDYKKVLASVSEAEEVDAKSIMALEANFDKVIASHAEEIRKEILEANKQYEDKIAEKENAVAKAAEEKAAVEKELGELKSAKEKQAEELETIKASLAAQEAARTFDERMGAIDNAYDLDEDSRKVVASSIKSLDEDGYANWFETFKIIAKEKSKEYKAKLDEKKKAEAEKSDKKDEKKEDKAKAAEASEKEAAQKVIASAKPEGESTPNSAHQEKVSLADEFAGLELELEK